ncbi:MAG TPA: hypothetical protein VMH88_13845 [Gemmatimonadales bacterium]|nr:hypothetical protein [Gemmatimonadales bacterium]
MSGPLRQPRSSLVRLASCALLLLQAPGAGGAALAHTTERSGGPVSVESRHTAQCAVLHDAGRCVLCHFAEMRSAVGPVWLQFQDPASTPSTTPTEPPFSHPGDIRPAAPSRGPPAFSA